MTLNLFPARVAIGRFNDKDQKPIDVYCTPEFFRAMSELFNRVGGASGVGINDLALMGLFGGQPEQTNADVIDNIRLLADMPSQAGDIAAVARALEDVQVLVGAVAALSAEVAELRKSAGNTESLIGYQDQFRVNWERPGKIGSLTANTGAYTTLSATGQITSTLATGTAPLVVASTTKVSNLNADLLDGTDWAAPGTIGGTTPASASFTTINASGQITSTLTTGTAPLVVASTTQVSNLNVSQLVGATWVAPGAIGSTTKNTGAFTTLSSSGQALLNGAASAGTAFGTIGTGNLLMKSYTGGSFGISLGASGGDYGEIGYNVDFQSSAGTYKYLVGDTAGSIQFAAGSTLLKGASSGSAGAALTLATWATVKATGIESTPIGATTPSTGRFTTAEVTAGGSTTISTGVGDIKMSSANAATNSAWIPIKYAGTTYYVPAFTTNSP